MQRPKFIEKKKYTDKNEARLDHKKPTEKSEDNTVGRERESGWKGSVRGITKKRGFRSGEGKAWHGSLAVGLRFRRVGVESGLRGVS